MFTALFLSHSLNFPSYSKFFFFSFCCLFFLHTRKFSHLPEREKERVSERATSDRTAEKTERK